MNTTRLPPAAPPPDAWWQRLHTLLMPDYNQRAALFWWLVVASGTAVLLACTGRVLAWPALVWLQVALATALAVGAGLFPVRVPGTKHCFVAGEVCIFFILLLHGPAAAALVAAGEAFMGSYRSSKRWTSRLFSPASAALAMLASGSLLKLVAPQIQSANWGDAAPLLATMLVFCTFYFFANAVLVAGVPRLKRAEPFIQMLPLISTFRWVGLAYAGSAAMATLLFVITRQQGGAVLLVMLPVLALLLVTLHFYFAQQESDAELRLVNAEAAARQAESAAREATAAGRFLQSLQASEARFYSAFTHASIGMALLAFDGRILQANPALCGLLGLDKNEPRQGRFQALVHVDEQPRLQALLGLANAGEFEGFAQELRCQHRDGHEVWLALHCGFFTEPGAATACLILQAQDVSARRSAEATLQLMAFHDSLTGLPNRRRFMECLSGAVTRCKVDAEHNFAVMFLDFDRFKLVNDSLGHGAGDALLVQLARRLQEQLRPGDIVARLGGDEFAILVDRIDHERDALVLAERLMLALQRPFVLGEEEITASASIGITFSAFGYDSADAALRDADAAMYKAKDAGKARYAVFDAGLHIAVAQRLRLEGELRQAIEQGQLTLRYQPLFELAERGPNRLIGFEALVRWLHPQRGLLGATDLLTLAEDAGLMRPLSDYVLHCACRQLRQWQALAPALTGLSMSVNLSAHDLADNPGQRTLAARVSQALVESGVRAEQLCLDLTEAHLLGGSFAGSYAGSFAGSSAGSPASAAARSQAHADAAALTLADLRRLGVQLALDDFGNGQCSLNQLCQWPINSLKIDRVFVGQAPAEDGAVTVLEAGVQLGQSLRKTVFAEGIETAAQLQRVRAMGCRFGQGFYLGQPLPAADTTDWLQRLVSAG